MQIVKEKIIPLDDRVLIEPMDSEEKIGSIIIPDTARKKQVVGKVIAVGTDKEMSAMFKVGNIVIYGKYAGEEIETTTGKILMVKREDIIGKYEVDNASTD